MALFLYHVVFGVRYLGILNGVAAFVIIGIGKGECTSGEITLSHYLVLLLKCGSSLPCLMHNADGV